MAKEKKEKRKEEAIVKELQMLEGMMLKHEWAVVGQEEAEEEERVEKELDSAVSD